MKRNESYSGPRPGPNNEPVFKCFSILRIINGGMPDAH